jgi:hypothetical protein
MAVRPFAPQIREFGFHLTNAGRAGQLGGRVRVLQITMLLLLVLARKFVHTRLFNDSGR